MTRFLGMVVMTGWRGPGGGDGRENDAFPGPLAMAGRSGPGDGGGSGGRQEGDDVVLTTEEERDNTVAERGGEGQSDVVVLGSGDCVEAVRMVAAWTRRCRRGRGKFS
jgi:hypothetical protein